MSIGNKLELSSVYLLVAILGALSLRLSFDDRFQYFRQPESGWNWMRTILLYLFQFGVPLIHSFGFGDLYPSFQLMAKMLSVFLSNHRISLSCSPCRQIGQSGEYKGKISQWFPIGVDIYFRNEIDPIDWIHKRYNPYEKNLLASLQRTLFSPNLSSRQNWTGKLKWVKAVTTTHETT